MRHLPRPDCFRYVMTRLGATVFLLASVTLASAAPPVIQSLQPRAIRPGEPHEFTIRGQNLAGVTQLWTSCSATAQTSPEKPAEAGQVTFRVELPGETPCGVHAVRVVGSEGVSSLALCLVDDLPAVSEVPNGTPEQAQMVTLPVAIDGHVDQLSRDYYRFEVQAGQRVSFEIFARRLGSALDPTLILSRLDGRELNYADDTPGLGGDCQLVHQFEDAGTYLLEVRDIRYSGSGNHFYRLRIGDFPLVNSGVPLPLQRGTSTPVSFAGIDLEGVSATTVDVPADWPTDYFPVNIRREQGATNAFAMFRVVDRPTVIDAGSESAEPIAVPMDAFIGGRFEQPRDVDRYVISAKAGDEIRVIGLTRNAGPVADLNLRLLQPDGAQLASVDDVKTAEASFVQAIKVDGDHILEVSDLLERGGDEYSYAIELSKVVASAELALASETVNIPRGGTAAVDVVATRHKLSAPIELVVDGLPPGITADPVIIGTGRNSATLTLRATEEAQSSAAAVTVLGTAGEGTQVQPGIHTEVIASRMPSLPYVPAPARRGLFVGVTPPAPVSLTTEPAQVSVRQGSSVDIVLRTARSGYAGEIALATHPAKEALPKSVSISLPPVPAEQETVTLKLSAGDDSPPGRYSLALTGSFKIDKADHLVWVPSLQYEVLPKE